jgi:hypothetical protein
MLLRLDSSMVRVAPEVGYVSSPEITEVRRSIWAGRRRTRAS